MCALGQQIDFVLFLLGALLLPGCATDGCRESIQQHSNDRLAPGRIIAFGKS